MPPCGPTSSYGACVPTQYTGEQPSLNALLHSVSHRGSIQNNRLNYLPAVFWRCFNVWQNAAKSPPSFLCRSTDVRFHNKVSIQVDAQLFQALLPFYTSHTFATSPNLIFTSLVFLPPRSRTVSVLWGPSFKHFACIYSIILDRQVSVWR